MAKASKTKTKAAAAAKPARKAAPAARKKAPSKASASPAARKTVAKKVVRKKAKKPGADRQAVNYAAAIERFQRGRYGNALTFFEKVIDGPDAGLKHRAAVYARVCRERAASAAPRLRGADENYDYGVKLVNDRQLDEAEVHLKKALRLSKNAPHVHYAMAVLFALRGDAEHAAENLRAAIKGDPRNRLLARADGDLANVASDPAVAGLLKS